MANEKGCLYPTVATYNWKKVFAECEETATNQKQKKHQTKKQQHGAHFERVV